MGDINLRLQAFIALDWSMLLFGLSFVVLRLFIRRHRPNASNKSRAMIISDACVVASWLSAGVLVGINTWKNSLRMRYLGQEGLYYGVPKHMAGHLLMVSWVSLFFIYISLWLAKAAFIAFYYTLFVRLGAWCTVVKAFVAVFTFATFLLHMALLVFWCQPVNLNWDVDGKLCSAVHSMNSVTISTFANVATDLLIILLPVLVLKHLTIHRAQIYVYTFVLGIGSISIVAALVRFGALKAVWGQPKASVTHTIDVWAMVEIVSSLMAVCLPALRVYFRGAGWGSSGGSGDGVGQGDHFVGSSFNLVSVDTKEEGRKSKASDGAGSNR